MYLYMKILILGSKGILGQELVKEFSQNGYSVFGLDKDAVDITNVSQVQKILEEKKPHAVINAAAYNAVDKIEESPEAFESAKIINGVAVGNLARLCRARDILLVHYSSDYVFAGNNKAGYTEDADSKPINKYGESKLLGEKLLQENTDKFYLIRLSKLFGRAGAGEGTKKSFVDTMIWLATEGGKTRLDVVDEEISSPTYAPDLAKFTRILIEQKMPFGFYHGANSGTCGWYEFARKIFELKNIKISINPVAGDVFPRPAKRPAYSALLNTKMPPQRNWAEALREYLQG